MNPSFWEAIANTPWWVYALLIYLIRLGLLATKPRIVTLNKLSLLPTIFVFFSLFTMYSTAQLNFTNFSFWVLALLLGGLFGWLHFVALKIRAIENQSKIHLPGTWSFLFFILVIFSAQYYLHYESNIDPTFFTRPHILNWLFVGYGFLSGLFLGRILYALRCIKSGPFLRNTSSETN